MNGRIVAGFFVAPLVPGAFIGASVLTMPHAGASALAMTLAIPAMVVFSAFYVAVMWGYPAALVFGIGAYLALSRWKVRSLLIYAAAAAIVGGAYVALFKMAVNHTEVSLPNILCNVAYGSFFGAIAGTAFWGIARPDRFSHG